jgi:uncharacterized membrane protein
VVSHPHAIEVGARDGKITLIGLILENELAPTLKAIAQIPGVREVDSQLEAHRPDSLASHLQGGKPRLGQRIDFLQTKWAPATRWVVGGLGSAMAIQGMRTKSLIGKTLTGVGSLMVLRSFTNTEIRPLLGAGGRGTFHFHKTIHLFAPVDEVFNFWSNFENFPEVAAEIRNVKVMKNGRSHWSVQGPLTFSVHWDAEVTRVVPNQLLAWKSVPGSLIQNAGRVRFFGEKDGTKIEIDFSYTPPMGILGHLLAKLLGTDPKARINQCLVEMKQKIEQRMTQQKAA